jgi:hypothetical protein
MCCTKAEVEEGRTEGLEKASTCSSSSAPGWRFCRFDIGIEGEKGQRLHCIKEGGVVPITVAKGLVQPKDKDKWVGVVVRSGARKMRTRQKH